ncbi:hypothetical protein [Meridianimarinicoccus roseus]|uniref:hypothetical protein n=1 Tax=Meridianimarinicoccus roseus TaxID=2072018 RepID=UPI001EE66AAC|nr:hypothetical protein [Meridianimarinicoccus roseus]
MDIVVLLPALALVTLTAVCIFALLSKAKVEQRRKDPSVPKSTLAKDAPNRSKKTA